jgi:muramoyltetrapeptide carboxypeptidase
MSFNVVRRALPVLALAVCVARSGPASCQALRAVAAWTRPAALKPGDTIAFVAPAGPTSPENVREAKARLERLGFRVQASALAPRSPRLAAKLGLRTRWDT